MGNLNAIRSELETRRAKLARRVQAISADLRARPNPKAEDRAIELENEDVLEDLDRVGLSELEQIESALRRIDAGTYGICVDCGKPIDPRRLEAIPFAPTCVACSA